MSEKMKNIVVRKNENGDILEVLELKTCLEYRAKELLNQAVRNQAKIDEEKVAKEQALEQERLAIATRVSKHDLFVAKALFNDYVEKGEMETSEIFENMFLQYVKGLVAYDESCEPRDFKKVLEGVR